VYSIPADSQEQFGVGRKTYQKSKIKEQNDNVKIKEIGGRRRRKISVQRSTFSQRTGFALVKGSLQLWGLWVLLVE